MAIDRFGQPVGDPLGNWTPPPVPTRDVLVGERIELAPLDATLHAADLWAEFCTAPESLWTYMGIGPFSSSEALAYAVDHLARTRGWVPYALLVDDLAVGFAAYLRIDPAIGSIEIGSIVFGPSLEKTAAATEALFLMIDHAFALAYRRCEWKCDALNARSRAAALRLGFQYEGTFRKATHYKGRNRDTAWYAIIDD
ncbi:MAG: GNAT family N-acetyltransferase, partial [Acidimicrobiia bacterium]|nr:GNAT family N-acetyltransferase [Acidimicrobiia bacterium]